MDEPSEDETRVAIASLIDRIVGGLRAVGDDRAAIVALFESYLDEGMGIIYSPSALWGYIETILRRAGLNTEQQDRRYRIFSTVTNQRFQGGKPYPPDWSWHEIPEAEQDATNDRRGM